MPTVKKKGKSGSNPTQFEHYMHYPICGHCTTAWDIIYKRQRAHTYSPRFWLEKCRFGGCDPDVWDYLDDSTGWPLGWKIRGGHPVWKQVVKVVPPDPDPRVFHKREFYNDANPHAPWRTMSARLLKMAQEQSALRRNGVPDDQIKWDDDDYAEPDEPTVADPDDDDIW